VLLTPSDARTNPVLADTTTIDHGPQTAGYYPCLKPDLFNPTALNADDWMAASASLGMREIILTAHHEGGFALWPSNFTPYSVAASTWRGGKGDVLREFSDAANRWNIKIGYCASTPLRIPRCAAWCPAHMEAYTPACALPAINSVRAPACALQTSTCRTTAT
jgi:alpha-L-fucosidase